jgi:Tol biopolymer transport system component/predicted Ser/Thr protein kinase
MPLEAGTKLGPYEILAAAGEGGMGEVYRARDTRLDRTVAIKVLSTRLADRPELRQRFEREARTISKLSHPHICTLHDVGQQEGVDFLVMEYLEGETLGHRLQRGALPVEQTLKYGIEIAEALETAHRQGIVHRDLKPGNVMLTKSGAKLMDFGLAKLVEQPAPVALSEMANAPTLPSGEKSLTEEGVIVGTFQYMAPEQLEGQEADARTDIFALGMVLYEMATGHPAFTGKTKASVIAAILASEPKPLREVQPVTPAALDRLVHVCLAKNPEERWQSARDIKLQLEGIRAGEEKAAPTTGRAAPMWRWIVAGALLAALAGYAGGRWGRTEPAKAPVYRTALPPPAGHFYVAYDFAISPDSSRLAFTATSADGVTTLWVKSLATNTDQEISGTQGAGYPFWSPDGRAIGFFAEGKLKKAELATAGVQTICDALVGRGGSWNRDGTIVFAPHLGAVLLRVPANGGAPVPATKLHEGMSESHRWPTFLPDGRHFLYFVDWSEGRDGLYVGSLEAGEGVLLSADIRGNVAFAAGHVLFVRDGTLYARPFDTEKLRFTGDPVAIVNQDLEQDPGFGKVGFSASESGALVYQSRRSYSSRLVWFDRSGKEMGTVGDAASYEPRLSPDGRWLAMTLDVATNGHSRVHVVDLRRGTMTAITAESDRNAAPVWSPDSTLLAYASLRTRIQRKAADGSGEPETLVEAARLMPNDWSRDGRYLAYMRFVNGVPEIWIYDFVEKKSSKFCGPACAEAQFSPDGHWISHSSGGRTAALGAVVEAFPGPGPRVQISPASGGTQGQWRADGKEFFYVGSDNRLMAVSIKSDWNRIEASTPKALFQTRMQSAKYALFQYAVSRDGQRFLINSLPREDAAAPMMLLTDWTAGLEK